MHFDSDSDLDSEKVGDHYVKGMSEPVKPQYAAEGRMAHNNVCNGANGMASSTWKPFV